jgi:hypothetical protein
VVEHRVVHDRASCNDDPQENADPRACAPGISRGGESGPDEAMRRMLAAAAAAVADDDDDDDDDEVKDLMVVLLRLRLSLPMAISNRSNRVYYII